MRSATAQPNITGVFSPKRAAPGLTPTNGDWDAMSMARGRVVLVEDDASMREAAERVLTATGFVVSGFDSAEVALQDQATMDARCLVLDVHLPGISGFEMYERLLAVGRKPAVIFITAHDKPINQNRAEQLGALAYLVKPFSGHELSAVVAKAFA